MSGKRSLLTWIPDTGRRDRLASLGRELGDHHAEPPDVVVGSGGRRGVTQYGMRQIAGQHACPPRDRCDQLAAMGGHGPARVVAWNRDAIGKSSPGEHNKLPSSSTGREIDERDSCPNRRTTGEPVRPPQPVEMRAHQKMIGRTRRCLVDGDEISGVRINNKTSERRTQRRTQVNDPRDPRRASVRFDQQSTCAGVALWYRVRGQDWPECARGRGRIFQRRVDNA